MSKCVSFKKKRKIRDKIREYSGFSREFRKRSGSESNRFLFRFRDQPFRFRPVSVFSRKSKNDRKNIENGTGIFPYFPVPFSSLPNSPTPSLEWMVISSPGGL